jgi:hypothetical protein
MPPSGESEKESKQNSPHVLFSGPFIVFNEKDERATIRRWFDHMREVSKGYSSTI